MKPSVEHEAIIVPKGENLTQLTPYACPKSGDKGTCLKTPLSSASHKRTDLSLEALTSNLVPVKSTQLTSLVCPSSIWCETSIDSNRLQSLSIYIEICFWCDAKRAQNWKFRFKSLLKISWSFIFYRENNKIQIITHIKTIFFILKILIFHSITYFYYFYCNINNDKKVLTNRSISCTISIVFNLFETNFFAIFHLFSNLGLIWKKI